MNWYVIYMYFDCSDELIKMLSQFLDIYAFKPKVEHWHKNSQVQCYQVKDMYGNYLFIRSSLNEKAFISKYKGLFNTVKGIGKLIKQTDVITLRKEEQEIISHLFKNKDTIQHSVGYIIDGKTVITEGPLMGLEDYIKKVNRHRRYAMLDFPLEGSMMKLPLEIVSKT